MGAGGFAGIKDMIDGGGAGMAGDTFKGGALSDIANQIGIKPMGYNDRQAMMPQNRQVMQQLMQQGGGGMAPQGMSSQGAGPVRPQARPYNGAPPVPPVQTMPLNSMGAPVYQPGQGPNFPAVPGSAAPSPMQQYYMMIEAKQRGLI